MKPLGRIDLEMPVDILIDIAQLAQVTGARKAMLVREEQKTTRYYGNIFAEPGQYTEIPTSPPVYGVDLIIAEDVEEELPLQTRHLLLHVAETHNSPVNGNETTACYRQIRRSWGDN